MKKLMSLTVVMLMMQAAFAQQVITEQSDPKATAILDKMNEKFNAYTSYELDIKVVIKIPDSEEPSLHTVKFIKKGDQYRVIGHDQKIYCNGQYVWIYTPKTNSVQLSDADDAGEDFVSPDKLFNMYKTGEYLYHISREFKKGKEKLTEIEFKPTDKMSDFFKVKMVVNKSTNQPKSIKVFYHDGVRVTMNLSGLKKNKAYGKDFFSFDKSKFPGVKLEDLRL